MDREAESAQMSEMKMPPIERSWEYRRFHLPFFAVPYVTAAACAVDKMT